MPSPSGYLNADIVRNDFSGGRVNVPKVLDAAQLRAGQSPLMRNVDTSGKSVRKMKGFSRLTGSPTAGDVSSIYFDTETKNIYGGYDNKIGKMLGSSITQLAGATGFTNNAIWSFTKLGDYLLCINGADPPHLWNENTATLSTITTPPATWGTGRPDACTSWMGRAFAWGCSPDVDVLYYSTLYDVTDWTPGVNATNGGALRIGEDGSPIKACWPLATGLLVFKDPGLYYLQGSTNTSGNFDQTTFDWILLSTEVDARAFRAVVGTVDHVYAWGREKVWDLYGTQTQQTISITPISNAISWDVAQVNESLSRQICAVHYAERNQVWFGVPKNNGSTGIDTIHCYDYVNKFIDPVSRIEKVGGWMLRDGYQHKCMANVRDVHGSPQIYSGGYTGNGYIFQQNNTVNYDGQPMHWQYYTDWIELTTMARGKPSLVAISLGPQSIQPISYSYAYDYATGSYASTTLTPTVPASTWHSSGSPYWGNDGLTNGTYQTGTGVELVKLLYGYGRKIQHRFEGNLLNADFAILEIKHPSTSVGYR